MNLLFPGFLINFRFIFGECVVGYLLRVVM